MTNYLIFARKEYQQPLEMIGVLEFDGDPTEAELDTRARTEFGGGGWLELIAVPESVITHVIPAEAGP